MQKEARIACETGLRLIERWKSHRNKYSFLYNDVSNEFCISVQVYSLLVNRSAWFSMVFITGSSLDLLSSNLALIFNPNLSLYPIFDVCKRNRYKGNLFLYIHF